MKLLSVLVLIQFSFFLRSDKYKNRQINESMSQEMINQADFAFSKHSNDNSFSKSKS